MGTPPPAGWFTSPDDDLLQRWWDGAAWTSFTRPVRPPADVPTQRVGVTAAHGRGRDAAGPPHDRRGDGRGALGAAAAGRAHRGLRRRSRPRRSPPSSAVDDPATRANGAGCSPTVARRSEPVRRRRAGTTASRGRRLVAGRSVLRRDRPGRSGRRRHVRPSAARRPMGPVGQVVFGLVFLARRARRRVVHHEREHDARRRVDGDRARSSTHTTHVDSDGKTLCSPVASFTVAAPTYTARARTSRRPRAARRSGPP